MHLRQCSKGFKLAFLHLCVIDNAKVFKVNSYGTKITETRLKLLNSFYGRKLGVKYSDSVTDSLTNKGTKVEFDLPIMN